MQRAAVVMSVLAGVLVLGACGSNEPRQPRFHSYVALGDSFTSGAGLPEATDQVCQRSRLNYPSLVADELGARLTDASCGGATTANVTTPQLIGTATVPPQLDAVGRDTDLVTVGLGYNDQTWFGSLFSTCIAMAAGDPAGHPCQDHPPVGGSHPEQAARDIGNQVEAVLEQVEKKAPHARVVLVGYPQLVPRSGTCPELPLAAGDYPFVRSMMQLLDDELRGAAHRARATYVDVLSASAGHDICAGDGAWVNGASAQPGVATSYHPFARGEAAVADLVVAAVRS